jgi:hypothetical protein
MQFRADRPFEPGRPELDNLDDLAGRAGNVGDVVDFPRAFGMHQDFDSRMFGPELMHMGRWNI